MRVYILLLAVIVFISCSQKEVEKVQSSIFIEQQLRDFISSNPEWTKDETTEKETTEKFKRKLINLSNDSSFLNGMPLQLKEVKDTAINEIRTKIAVFKAYGDTSRSDSSLLNYMQVQIDGIVSQSQVGSLQVGNNYILAGTLHKQGKRSDVKYINVGNFKGYDLGKYTFLITGIKPL